MRNLFRSLVLISVLFITVKVHAGSVWVWGIDAINGAELAENDFVAIAAGSSHGLALKSDGSIVGWGYDGYDDHASRCRRESSLDVWGLQPAELRVKALPR